MNFFNSAESTSASSNGTVTKFKITQTQTHINTRINFFTNCRLSETNQKFDSVSIESELSDNELTEPQNEMSDYLPYAEFIVVLL